MLKCSCGGTLLGTDGKYYKCVAAVNKKDAANPCYTKRYNASSIEHTVWKWVEEHVLDECNLRAGIEKRNASQENTRKRLEEERAYYTEALSKVDRETERLKTLYTSGLFTLEETAKDKRKLDTERDKLRGDIAQVDAKIESLGIPPNAALRIIQAVREVCEKLPVITNETRRQILEWAEVSAVVYMKDGAPWLHIEAALTDQEDDVFVSLPG